MGAAHRLHPYGRDAEQLDVHGAKNVGLEILTDGHNRDIVIANARLTQGYLVATISNDCLCQSIGELADILLVGIDAQNMVPEPCQLGCDRAAEYAETDDGKTSIVCLRHLRHGSPINSISSAAVRDKREDKRRQHPKDFANKAHVFSFRSADKLSAQRR